MDHYCNTATQQNQLCQYKTYSHLNTFCQILELTVGGGGLFKKGLWCEIKAKTGAEGFLGTTFLLLQEGIGHQLGYEKLVLVGCNLFFSFWY